MEHKIPLFTMETSVHTFCTIITNNYLPYANTLLASIRKFNSNINFNVIFSNVSDSVEIISPSKDGQTYYHFTNDLCQSGVGKQIFDKYSGFNSDAFRWSMKPVFLNYLIRKKKYEKVIYVDCDIFFFNQYMYLFEELNNYSVLLTPHWRSKDPIMDYDNFKCLFKDGLYNGGFIGINKNGVSAMDWWARACLLSCAKGEFEGQFDDQAYLNLLPVYFDHVKILKHQGCNVAVWNKIECKRVMQPDGTIKINDRYPIVFIHFVKKVFWDSDVQLNGYLHQFLETLKAFSPELYQIEMDERFNNVDKTAEIKKNQSNNRSIYLKIGRFLSTNYNRFLKI